MILFEIGQLNMDEILKYGIISLVIAIIILLLVSLISTVKLLFKKDSPKYKFKPAIIKDVDEYLSLYDDETEFIEQEKFDILECAKKIELSLKSSETVCVKKEDFYVNESSSVSYKEMKKLKDTGKLQIVSFDDEEENVSIVDNNIDMSTKINSLVKPTIAHSVGPIETKSFTPRQIPSPIFGSGNSKKLNEENEVVSFHTTQQLISEELNKAEELLNGLKQLQELLK